MRILVPPFGPRVQRFLIAIAAAALLLIWIGESFEGRRDWLLITGWLAFIVGLWMAETLPERLEDTLDRLVDRGVLAMTPERLTSFKQDIERRIQRRWAPIGGGSVVALALLGSFVRAFGRSVLTYKFPLLAAEMVGGYIAGCLIGRMVCYGRMGPFIGKADIKLRMIPGHLDTAAGLKPVGNFYFRQATVVGIPAIFLAAWLVLIPHPYFLSLYGHWLDQYRWLLLLAILFEVLSFVAPLLWIHREMLKQKRVLLKRADELSAEIADIQRYLEEINSADAIKDLKERLEEKISRYLVLEQLPVWPIDLKTKRLFSISNFALVLPFVTDYAGLSGPWAEFLKRLSEKMGSH
jgi:hypothetical protein